MPEKNFPNIIIKKKIMNEGDTLGEYCVYSLYEKMTDANNIEMTTYIGEFNEIQMKEQVANFTKQKDYWEYILSEASKL